MYFYMFNVIKPYFIKFTDKMINGMGFGFGMGLAFSTKKFIDY